jgi:hypothetical protein
MKAHIRHLLNEVLSSGRVAAEQDGAARARRRRKVRRTAARELVGENRKGDRLLGVGVDAEGRAGDEAAAGQ